MRSRIAMWAGAGFLVAGCWVLFVFATHPNTNEWMRYVWPLAFVTCPVTAVGSRFPVSLYQVLAANAVTYALLGLIVELTRRRFQTQR
jgi:uncharacterized BrkB/YihY/UPF0761 family membrane protein